MKIFALSWQCRRKWRRRVKSVGLAAPQTSVRPVELLTILLLVSQSSLDTSRDAALTGGQLEILGGEAKYSWALMLHSSGKWRISAILSGSTGRTLPPCCIPKPDLWSLSRLFCKRVLDQVTVTTVGSGLLFVASPMECGNTFPNYYKKYEL